MRAALAAALLLLAAPAVAAAEPRLEPVGTFALLRKLRRALRQGRRPRVTVRIRLSDAAGNTRVRRVHVRLRR